MTGTSGSLLVLAALVCAAPIRAQSIDVSGVWLRADSSTPSVATSGDAAFRAGTMGPGWGTPLTLTQRADSLIVEYEFFSAYDLQPPVRLAYALDGSRSRNSIMIGHATVEQRGRAAVRDGVLVLTTVFPAPPDVPLTGAVEVRQTLSLVSPTQLAIETTRSAGTGVPPVTTRTVYTRR